MSIHVVFFFVSSSIFFFSPSLILMYVCFLSLSLSSAGDCSADGAPGHHTPHTFHSGQCVKDIQMAV